MKIPVEYSADIFEIIGGTPDNNNIEIYKWVDGNGWVRYIYCRKKSPCYRHIVTKRKFKEFIDKERK